MIHQQIKVGWSTQTRTATYFPMIFNLRVFGTPQFSNVNIGATGCTSLEIHWCLKESHPFVLMHTMCSEIMELDALASTHDQVAMETGYVLFVKIRILIRPSALTFRSIRTAWLVATGFRIAQQFVKISWPPEFSLVSRTQTSETEKHLYPAVLPCACKWTEKQSDLRLNLVCENITSWRIWTWHQPEIFHASRLIKNMKLIHVPRIIAAQKYVIFASWSKISQTAKTDGWNRHFALPLRQIVCRVLAGSWPPSQANKMASLPLRWYICVMLNAHESSRGDRRNLAGEHRYAGFWAIATFPNSLKDPLELTSLRCAFDIGDCKTLESRHRWGSLDSECADHTFQCIPENLPSQCSLQPSRRSPLTKLGGGRSIPGG